MENNMNFDVKKIMGELVYLIDANTNRYELYNYNKEHCPKGILALFSIATVLKTAHEQDKLILEMNKNVKKEWNPRIKLLKDNQSYFKDNMELYNAFIEFKRIDKTMQKMTILGINVTNFKLQLYSDLKMATKVVAVAGITAIAIGGLTLGVVGIAQKSFDRQWFFDH